MKHKQNDKWKISIKVYNINQMNSCRNVQEEKLDIFKWQKASYETRFKLMSLWTWEHKLRKYIYVWMQNAFWKQERKEWSILRPMSQDISLTL